MIFLYIMSMIWVSYFLETQLCISRKGFAKVHSFMSRSSLFLDSEFVSSVAKPVLWLALCMGVRSILIWSSLFSFLVEFTLFLF
jgi:hypothetical protein